jgi:hypothetical protein
VRERERERERERKRERERERHISNTKRIMDKPKATLKRTSFPAREEREDMECLVSKQNERKIKTHNCSVLN